MIDSREDNYILHKHYLCKDCGASNYSLLRDHIPYCFRCGGSRLEYKENLVPLKSVITKEVYK